VAVYWNAGILARDTASARAVMAYFEGHQVELDGTWFPLEVVSTDVPGGVLVGVWPRGMNWGSPYGSDPRLTTDEAIATITHLFDDWLRAAPPFMAGSFGAEAYDSLLGGFDYEQHFEGLVVDRATWERLGADPAADVLGPDRYAWPLAR
jgi:hypothetical protein